MLNENLGILTRIGFVITGGVWLLLNYYKYTNLFVTQINSLSLK